MQGPSIEFENVNLSLGNTRILQDISFSIRPGKIHCIIGANGGGKTSLILSMLGQMPHSGNITIDWHDNRVIGYVPQTLEFDKTLPVTVRDFMGMTCQRRPVFLGIARSRHLQIAAVLDRVGLASKSKSILGSLSGGERQRLAIARAVLGRPKLLIFDEPTNHLDSDSVERLMAGLMAWPARPAIITISHDSHLLSYVDDLYRLSDGQLQPAQPRAMQLR